VRVDLGGLGAGQGAAGGSEGVVGHAVQVHGETVGEVTGVGIAQCGDRIGEPAGLEAP